MHYQQALSRSLRPNFDLDFANLQTQKVNIMNTRIRREFKCPKQLAFDTELFGSTAQLVHACNVRSHAESDNSLSHPDEQKPRSEQCKSQYSLEANGYGI